MRKFLEPRGNSPYGIAVAANEGQVVIGIREKDKQGEIVVLDNLSDLSELISILRQAQIEAFTEPMTYDEIKEAALRLSRNDLYKLSGAIDFELGSFTIVSVDVDDLMQDINDGDWQDFGVQPYGVLRADVFGALYDVARRADAPPDYRLSLFEWAVDNLREDHCPLLVPGWCAGLGG